MDEPLCPALYQINMRVWLTELSQALGRPATLDESRIVAKGIRAAPSTDGFGFFFAEEIKKRANA